MSKRKLRRRFMAEFGSVPDPLYLAGDMEHIRAYHDVRREMAGDAFFIDDVTWNDLEMDQLFCRINPGLSTSGEQMLYHHLRAPASTQEEYDRRAGLAALMGEDPDLRVALQLILHRLGCARRADMNSAFRPRQHHPWWLILYVLLVAVLVASLFLLPLLGEGGIVLPLCCLIVCGLTHEFRRTACERDYATVNYAVRMVQALRRVQKLHNAALDGFFAPAYACLPRLRAVLTVGGVSPMGGDMLTDMMNTVLLTDLMAYEFLKNKLGRCHREIFCVHEALGEIDAAIAVASFRASLPGHAIPHIDFAPGRPRLEMQGLRHPLMPEGVPNDLTAERSVLLTGSNASGKSTFLKAVLLNAILAQGLCTAACSSYRGTAFRPMTSMALRDSLLAGESYFVVELRSLRRILLAAEEPGLPVLCAVDEVLRGTNTVERIAASCEVLTALAAQGALCLAATHDGELCALLAEDFSQYHFEEQLTEERITFDYRLRPGPATSRNAIGLLRLMGFPQGVVEGADERAAAFLRTGTWRA